MGAYKPAQSLDLKIKSAHATAPLGMCARGKIKTQATLSGRSPATLPPHSALVVSKSDGNEGHQR